MYYDFYYDEKLAREDRQKIAMSCSNIEHSFVPNLQ
jgi:hypothetical protein